MNSMSTPMAPPMGRLFLVGDAASPERIHGRGAALQRARELSQTTWRPVRVTSDDTRTEVVYRRGHLVEYKHHGRHGRRR